MGDMIDADALLRLVKVLGCAEGELTADERKQIEVYIQLKNSARKREVLERLLQDVLCRIQVKDATLH